jgi:2-iminobutanoate/2-iminopropanoate deaminase
MTLRAINAVGAPRPIAPYSPAIDTGSLVFVSGQIGADPASGELLEGVAAQAERVLKNIVAILDAAGLTLSDVAKTTCFLADINDFNAFNEVYARYFDEPKPARSTYAVAALPRGARVEIEAIAVRG